MTKSSKTILTLALTIFTVLFLNSAFAELVKSESKPIKSAQKTKSFYVSSREPYLSDDDNELCRITAKILNEPENQRFSEIGFSENVEFVIPEKYKDFSLPHWEDVSREDFTKYIKSERWLKDVTDYEKRFKSVSAKAVLRKTQLDLNHDGKKEEIIQLQFSNHPEENWSCYVSDAVPSVVSDGYNNHSSIANRCRFFLYKGKPFQTMWHNYDYFYIGDPHMGTTTFVVHPICAVSLTPLRAKVVKKAAQKIWDEYARKNQSALDISNSPTSNSKNSNPTK